MAARSAVGRGFPRRSCYCIHRTCCCPEHCLAERGWPLGGRDPEEPLKARGYNGLGLAYFNKNQYGRAIESFAKAIALHPSYGVAFNNIGTPAIAKASMTKLWRPRRGRSRWSRRISLSL